MGGIALLGHIPPNASLSERTIFPIISLSLWGFNTIMRLARMAYYSLGHKIEPQAAVEHFYTGLDESTVSAIRLTIQLRRPLIKRPIRPGQYAYLHFSDMGVRRRIQSHPYAIAWWDDSLNATSLSFLIQPQSGISTELTSRKSVQTVYIDGPYGKDLKLDNCETVILIAKGIGIAGVLSYLRHMTYRRVSKAKEHGSYRRGLITRNIDVYWIMEDNYQQDWVSEWIAQLHERDSENVSLNQKH